MADQLGVVLDFLMRPGVEYNMQKRKYWGVLFHQKLNAPVSAIVASAFFAIEMENVAVDPKGQFFYYVENEWGPSPYPRPAENILEAFKMVTPAGHITAPLPNLLNHIGKLHEDVRKRSRIIFSPGRLDRNDVILRFVKEADGIIRARNPKSPKAFLPVNGPFPPDFGMRGQFYKCRILGEEEDIIMVEVIDIYGKVRLGVKHSPQGFIPDSMEAINDLKDIAPELIYGINQTMPQKWFPFPTHVDCMMLYDLLKVFSIIETKFVDISFSYDPNRPMIIRNRKESPLDPQINVVVATLNQGFGAQRR
jgi:hypothetical protein